MNLFEKKPLILIGAGGHCIACIDVIEEEGSFQIHGILDTEDKVGTELLGYPVIGTDAEISAYIAKNYWFLITIGQINTAILRKRIFENLRAQKAQIATLISPKASISKHAKIGIGTIVLHSVNINAEVLIGANCILNTGCIIEHECVLAETVHIAPGAVLAGNVHIGENSFVGANSVIKQGVDIGKDVVVGTGTVVITDILDGKKVVGNPSRII